MAVAPRSPPSSGSCAERRGLSHHGRAAPSQSVRQREPADRDHHRANGEHDQRHSHVGCMARGAVGADRPTKHHSSAAISNTSAADSGGT